MDADRSKPAARPCPICGKPAQTRYRPFCSARCADVDLGRWMKESYVILEDAPVEEDETRETPRRSDENSIGKSSNAARPSRTPAGR